MGSKKLVAYFSASGVTAKLAKELAEAAGADLYEIQPRQPYSSIEMSDPDSRPAISGNVENMELYDTVFVGFPIWWYEAPGIIHTFLESYDFSGKTLIPFATSGSSGMGETDSILKKYCSSETKWKPGKRFSSADKGALKSWIDSLGL